MGCVDNEQAEEPVRANKKLGKKSQKECESRASIVLGCGGR